MMLGHKLNKSLCLFNFHVIMLTDILGGQTVRLYEWFPQKLMEDYGLEGLVYGEYFYIKNGEEIEEKVKDPYFTLETTMYVEIRGREKQLHDRDKMIIQISKPHIEYDNETKYKFIMHQIKYKLVRETLSYVRGGDHYKKFYRVKKSTTEEFDGIDICTKEHIHLFRTQFEQTEYTLSKEIMKTHAEQFERGYHSDRGVICIPTGVYYGSIFYNKIDWHGSAGAYIELVRFHADKGQINKEQTIITLADGFKTIKTSLTTHVQVPWENLIKHPMDLWRNPLNKEIWHLLPSAKLYEGNYVFVNYDNQQAFIRVVDQWIPTNLIWLLNHKSAFLKEIEDEIRIVINITDLKQT